MATEATFGYEWAGDNLYLARRNLLTAFCEAYRDKFCVDPTPEMVDHIAGILSWNIWQMDGLTDCVPMTDIPAKILDRETHKVIEFRSLKGGDTQCTGKPKSRTKSA